MTKLAIFDLDGTIADTSEGILNSHRHAHRMMGVAVPEDSVLYSVIGGNLLSTYKTRFGFSDSDAVEAVRRYREYYAERGIHEARPYDGIEEMLSGLKKRGVAVAMATLKAETFAIEMMRGMKLSGYFDAIYGMDSNDSIKKEDMLKSCVIRFSSSSDDAFMIGDTMNDFLAAKKGGTGFIGVSYGFGTFDSSAGNIRICSAPSEIVEFFDDCAGKDFDSLARS